MDFPGVKTQVSLSRDCQTWGLGGVKADGKLLKCTRIVLTCFNGFVFFPSSNLLMSSCERDSYGLVCDQHLAGNITCFLLDISTFKGHACNLLATHPHFISIILT